MAWYVTKVLISAVLIVLIAEVSKRSSLLGAVLASVPLVSVLAMIWLYVDTRDVEKVAALSRDVFWLVLPSLSLFLIMPPLLKRGLPFAASLGIGLAAMLLCYFGMLALLGRLGLK